MAFSGSAWAAYKDHAVRSIVGEQLGKCLAPLRNPQAANPGLAVLRANL
jgi:hypothetical protein